MATNLFVGNLAFATTSTQLRSIFEDHGDVADAQVITDRQTGESRGFGFVEMVSREEAEKAISALDGRDVSGRPLEVNVAKPRSG